VEKTSALIVKGLHHLEISRIVLGRLRSVRGGSHNGEANSMSFEASTIPSKGLGRRLKNAA